MQTWCCGWWWQLVVAEKYVAKFGSTSQWWKMCQIPPTRSSQKMVGQLIRNHFQKMDNVVCFVCASIHCLSNANAPLAGDLAGGLRFWKRAVFLGWSSQIENTSKLKCIFKKLQTTSNTSNNFKHFKTLQNTSNTTSPRDNLVHSCDWKTRPWAVSNGHHLCQHPRSQMHSLDLNSLA